MTTLLPATGPLRGTVKVPGDKSICHRAVMLGGLAVGQTHIAGFSGGADNLSTIDVLRALGATITMSEAEVLVRGGTLRTASAPLDCGNSGTTMRLMTGVLAGLGLRATLVGDASLHRRPMERVAGPLRASGLNVETTDGKPPIEVYPGGQFDAGSIDLQVASAQAKSCLLLAALGRGAALTVTEPHASRDHTENLLRAMGVDIESSAHYRAPADHCGRASVHLCAHAGPLGALRIDVPGDISSAAFLLAAGAMVPGSRVELPGCGLSATRAGVLEALRTAGVPFGTTRTWEAAGEACGDLWVEHGGARGMTVTAPMVPRLVDEVPVLAVLAAQLPGVSVFEGIGELRVKECDRLAATVRLLSACGRRTEVVGDDLRVFGEIDTPLRRFGFDPEHDHRMVAAAAVAALAADGPCDVDNVECLGVSYPGFLTDLEALRT